MKCSLATNFTVKKKFDAVFVVVATSEDERCNDLTNIVHMTALKANTKPKHTTRAHSDTYNTIKSSNAMHMLQCYQSWQ